VFELRSPQSAETFFNLPWPNDARRYQDGTLDLTFFPADTPVVQDYVALFDGTIDGFSTQGGVYFRFSGPIDAESLPADSGASIRHDSPVVLVNVDSGSPAFGRRIPVQVSYRQERKSVGAYALAVLPQPGFVLRPRTTYAVVLTRGIRGGDGKSVRPGRDLTLVLSDDPPAGSQELMVWQSYAPLRENLAAVGIDEAQVVSAAVFETQDPVSMMGALRDAVYRDMAGPPVAQDLMHFESHDTFHLYGGVYDAPVYQHGEPPYTRQGGDLHLDGEGHPIMARVEQVRFAVSVPRGNMPEDGWPIVLYAHGTGGDYLSFYWSGVAENLAQVEITGGRSARFAVMGIDQVLHGTRCGQESCNPEMDFFNFNNPLAGRDNVRQGALDNFQLVRLAATINEARAPVTEQAFSFDREHIYFMGHSQGGLTGPPFLAYASRIRAAVLSGAGGNMILSLLQKDKPVDIPALVAIMLDDEEVDRFHPVLTLLQTFIEPADALNYGRLIISDPPFGCKPKSIYQSQGLVDHYTPPDLIEALGLTLGLDWVEPQVEELDGFALAGQTGPQSRPVSGNIDEGQATGVFVQYPESAGSDGHFVVFDREDAKTDYATFLATDYLDGIPTLH
jgi:predicted esterase